jgi:hypothetical protein
MEEEAAEDLRYAKSPHSRYRMITSRR